MSAARGTAGRRTGAVRARAALRRGRPGTYLLLSVLAVYATGPMLLLLLSAVRSPAELSAAPLGRPAEFRWRNLATAWTDAAMGTALLNSAVIVLGTAAGVCVISGLAAYALARLDLPRPGVVMLYLLAVSALPIQVSLVPLLSWWTTLGLYDTRFGLVVIYWALYSPFATLLLRSYLLAIPPEYEAAARVDGAGELRVLVRIVLPLVWPGVLAAALVSGLQAYNEFLLAVTFIQDGAALPASVALYSFQQGYATDYALVSAAGTIMVLPMLAVFLLLQRRFIAGYAASGVVG